MPFTRLRRAYSGGHNCQKRELRPPLFLVWEATIGKTRNCGLRFSLFGRPQLVKRGIAASAFPCLGGHNWQKEELWPPFLPVWEATIGKTRNCGLRFFSFGRPQLTKDGIAASAQGGAAGNQLIFPQRCGIIAPARIISRAELTGRYRTAVNGTWGCTGFDGVFGASAAGRGSRWPLKKTGT